MSCLVLAIEWKTGNTTILQVLSNRNVSEKLSISDMTNQLVKRLKQKDFLPSSSISLNLQLSNVSVLHSQSLRLLLNPEYPIAIQKDEDEYYQY